MNDIHDIHKLTGAYATDAVDDLERARFEQHLATCGDCRAEVAELHEAAARLSEITAATPPASLRDSVLSGIAQVRPLPPPADAPRQAPQELTRQDSVERRRGPGRWMPLLVAAVLALIAGVALSSSQPWGSEERTPSAAEQVLNAPDAEKVWVDLGPNGRAEVVRSKSVDRAVIVTEGMDLPPEGQVYQLWYQPIGTEDMVPAGLMPRDEDTTVVLEGSASKATTVGITIEPEGGSKEPTTAPIAVFDLTEAT